MLPTSAFLTSLSLLVSAIVAHASPLPSPSPADSASNASNVQAKLITSCTVPNTAALTFDDGPYIYMDDIIDTLNKANAKATFFFNGNNWGCIYDPAMVQRVQHAYDAGFQIGSHTWAHKNLTTLSREEIDSEMARTEEAIRKITGATPAYTRPPYGSYNQLVLDVAGARGQTVVNWDFDSGDSTGSSVDQQKAAYDELVKRRPATVLSLEHEVYETSAHQVLPYAISKLQAAKYKLVTLSECLGGTAPYLNKTAPAARDASWKC